MTGITIEHEQIISWAQSRGGRPALEQSPRNPARPIIRFADEQGDKNVSWDEWMLVFDREQWAFIYQDGKSQGEPARGWKTVPRFASEPLEKSSEAFPRSIHWHDDA